MGRPPRLYYAEKDPSALAGDGLKVPPPTPVYKTKEAPAPVLSVRETALTLAVKSCGPVNVQGSTENVLQRAEKFLIFLTAKPGNPPAEDRDSGDR